MIDLIPTGEENAVLLKDLAVMVGKSQRTVQADVKRLRDRGYLLILSSASGGYYFPSADKKERRGGTIHRNDGKPSIWEAQALDER